MCKQNLKYLLSFFVISALSACGVKGPLYEPKPQAVTKQMKTEQTKNTDQLVEQQEK